jgi:hypothetical protein
MMRIFEMMSISSGNHRENKENRRKRSQVQGSPFRVSFVYGHLQI